MRVPGGLGLSRPPRLGGPGLPGRQRGPKWVGQHLSAVQPPRPQPGHAGRPCLPRSISRGFSVGLRPQTPGQRRAGLLPTQDTPAPVGKVDMADAAPCPAAAVWEPTLSFQMGPFLSKKNQQRFTVTPASGTRRLCKDSRHLSGPRAATLAPRARRECYILKSIPHAGQVPTDILGPLFPHRGQASPHVPPPLHLHLVSPPEPHRPGHPKHPQVGDTEHRRLEVPLSAAPQAGRPPRRTVGSHTLPETPQGMACWSSQAECHRDKQQR